MQKSTLYVGVACLSAVLSLGCGDSGPAGPEQLATVPASGTVTYRGTAIPDAEVSFQRMDGKAVSVGKTGADGKFTLLTYGDKPGAPAGEYRVTVSVSAVREISPGVLAPEPPGGFQSPIPVQYGNPTQSGLQVMIPETGNENIVLDLK